MSCLISGQSVEVEYTLRRADCSAADDAVEAV